MPAVSLGLSVSVLPQAHAPAADAPRTGKCAKTIIARSQIFLDHALPGRPVVRVPGLPGIELVRNSLVAHDAIQILVLPQALVVPSRGKNVGIPPVAFEVPGIGEIGQVVGRLVEVAVLVVVAAEKTREIERSRHGEEAGKKVGPTEGDVGRVIASKAAAERNQMRIAVLEPHQRQYLVHEIVFVLHMAGDAPARWYVAVVPAL